MDELIPLRDARLGDLSVPRPGYDRSRLKPGIVHIGVGNFHRAHQAWYLHRLMQDGQALDWAVLGAGVRDYDAAMRSRLRAQDCLTTLVELGPDSISAEVTGAMADYLPVEADNAALVAAMADPAIRIVSLTVTESGYFVDPSSKRFDADHPDIRHDIAHPGTPRTAFGAMVAALSRRRAAGLGPFTGLSCDNLQGNGDILRQTILSLAGATDPELASWIESRMTFPNSMVDCIAPATGPAELELVRGFGIDDAAPVTHEPFRQWVIEDRFCAGRPDFDRVGVTFSDDVHAYETMKIRILNGGHQVVANAGELLGLDTITEAMQHPRIAAFFGKVQAEEIAPTVAPVPGRTPEAYVALITERFANPRIVDTVRRVAFDGSARHAGFILPVIEDRLAAGGTIAGLALVEAIWARMCAGTREDGSAIEPNDPLWTDLTEAAAAARSDPSVWLAQSRIYGTLGRERRFAEAFDGWLNLIWSEGCSAALDRYTSPR
ncbi:mannitol dehydrogenase family protein [Oceanomicrobium pacificus]|uniref:Mannitol dehydrogenase family protein n=1 Tax=Oceanomicrobium pacificus TaxID=2692916 RepID=A0A6B0TQY8_9RHOB|nr:mannitol dehydrogenase family protein [Oceanomicrobium pacificus]MXU65099.1 mannitol dehydrogenase family protein [Oceanomicrobium pacificus]